MHESSNNYFKKAKVIPSDYQIHYFTASTDKLILLSLCSFGTYAWYWFYKNWQAIKEANINCSPFWRALLSPFFAFSLFRYIRDDSLKNNIDDPFPITFLAFIYFFLVVASNLPAPFFLISYLSIAPLVIANRIAIKVNQTQLSNFVSNKEYSIWNLLTIIFGGLLTVVCIIFAFIPSSLLQ